MCGNGVLMYTRAITMTAPLTVARIQDRAPTALGVAAAGTAAPAAAARRIATTAAPAAESTTWASALRGPSTYLHKSA